MQLWKGNCRRLGIIVVFLVIISFISAQKIEVNIPSDVEINEKFDAKIRLIDFPDDKYDLKMDILGDGERIAEIDGKSTYYFVSDVFTNNEAEVSLEIVKEFEGDAMIIIKIRNSKGVSKTFDNYTLEVEKPNTPVAEEKEENKVIEKKFDDKAVEIKAEADPLVEQRELISLVPQSIKNTQDSEVIFKSTNERIKEYAIYGFAVFCAVIITLLLIDKKKGNG